MLPTLVWVATFFIACAAQAQVPDYQCWNFKSTNDIRHSYLTKINNLRKMIAEGTAPNKDNTNCPSGQNIYRLYWDCALEVEAQKAVDQCTVTTNAPANTSIVMTKVSLTTCNPTPLFKQTVDGWWNVVKTHGIPADNPVFNNQNLASFATLANGRATRVGCAQKNCNGDLYMACIVFDKAPQLNQLIYEKGPGCTDRAQCTTFAGSKCSNKLCIAGYIDPTATTTTSATTATASTASTAASTTPAGGTTTSTVPPSQTTMCQNQGNISSDPIRKIFLDLHNHHRSELALGRVNNGNPQTFARKASKMTKLEYNCTLEKSAFEWAKQCKDEDSTQGGGVTQNRYTFPNLNLGMDVVARRASNRWWEEITKVHINQAPGQNLFQSNSGLSHWAKMAWDTTRYFGCAIYKCPTFINAVCYYQGGAVPGGQVYKMGPECRRCSEISARSCENGLCVM